ncbi:MAG: hypothetical protein SOH93_05385 [Oscillospiraceae bacterium]|jgi:Tfp pilus assembly protein FimT|nr:exported protein of unknown function [Ruminococcaceae bacterium BL-4]
MKRAIPILLIFCALLAIVSGFFLPSFVSAMQDQKLKTKVNTYETSSLQFHPVTQLKDSLQLLTGEYTTEYLENGSNLDGDGAYQAALDTMRFMAAQGAAGILSEKCPDHTEMPFLVVSADKTMSAIMWRCALYSKSFNKWIDILIDDSSGKMLAFNMISDQAVIDAQSTKDAKEQANKFSSKLADICSNYYGWKTENVQINGVLTKDNLSDYSIKGSIKMRDDGGDLVVFPLTISGDQYTFNTLLRFRGIIS